MYADFCNFFGDAAPSATKWLSSPRALQAWWKRDPKSITVSRLSTLVITESAEETAATWEFLHAAAGDDASGFNVGTEDEIVAQVEELAAAGVEYFIFNMPTSGADAVRRAGGLLASL